MNIPRRTFLTGAIQFLATLCTPRTKLLTVGKPAVQQVDSGIIGWDEGVAENSFVTVYEWCTITGPEDLPCGYSAAVTRQALNRVVYENDKAVEGRVATLSWWEGEDPDVVRDMDNLLDFGDEIIRMVVRNQRGNLIGIFDRIQGSECLVLELFQAMFNECEPDFAVNFKCHW